jgi:DNA polymerase elongation subunit (family B)
MGARYKPIHRSKMFFKNVNNLHRFRVDIFLGLIDRQYQELKNRFDEVNTQLLVCMSSFNPVDSFPTYDQIKLVKLAHFYPKDFSKLQLQKLPYQLDMFVADMLRDKRFRKVKNIAHLSVMLVETKKEYLP